MASSGAPIRIGGIVMTTRDSRPYPDSSGNFWYSSIQKSFMFDDQPLYPGPTRSNELIPAVTQDPTGHEVRLASNISFNYSTPTFTIQPTNTSYNVWVAGTQYTKSTALSVILPPTTGMYYIYFDTSGNLGYQTAYFTWGQQAPTAYIYYNSDAPSEFMLFDERHGIVMDWASHEYLHRTRGAQIASGLNTYGYTTTGNGSLETDAQISVANGIFFDEDLQIEITHSPSPTGVWEQVLQGPAYIPVIYKESGSGIWRKDIATAFCLKKGTSRPLYNHNTGGAWTTQEVDNNKYIVQWICATNMVHTPIIAIMGQAQYYSVNETAAAKWSDLDLTNFPVVEFRPISKIAFYASNTYNNSVKSKIVYVEDLRSITTVSGQPNIIGLERSLETPLTVTNSGGTGSILLNHPAGSTGVYYSQVLQVTENFGDTGATGTVRVAGNIIPGTHNTYTLGATGNAWKDAYIGPGTLHVGTATVGAAGTALLLNSSNAGKVGIGISNPGYPLHVVSSAGTTNGYLSLWPGNGNGNGQGQGQGQTLPTDSFGVVVESINGATPYSGAKAGFFFSTFGSFIASDRRNKTDITDISDGDALVNLRNIKPSRYRYIDTVTHTDTEMIGFIAQDVDTYFPHAVRRTTEFVPNIYATRLVQYNQVGDITYCTVTDISEEVVATCISGQLLRLYDISNNRYDIPIYSIDSSDSLTIIMPTDISSFNEGTDYEGIIFIYGTQVSDFYTLNKEYLFTINFAATQEIDRQVQDLKNEVQDLTARNTLLESQIVELQGKLDTILDQLGL